MSLNDALDDSYYSKDVQSMNMQGEPDTTINAMKYTSPILPTNEQFDGYKTQQVEASEYVNES